MSSDDVIPLPTSALSEIMHSGKKSCRNKKIIKAWRKEIAPSDVIIRYDGLKCDCQHQLLSSDPYLHTQKAGNMLRAAYHWFPEELVLGVVFAENEPGVASEGPGRLDLQHHLVVLQTPF